VSQPIHQEVVFRAPPKRIYEALTDARQFSTLSGGAPAEIAKDAGGAFSLFGGAIQGRHIELVPNERVVQAWRVGTWPAGFYSIARFELKAQGGETQLVFDHDGFPDADRPHLDAGWHKMYWEPLIKFIA
jgi:activator of HSP90 ATPase